MPRTSSGIDFSKIFRGLQNTTFQASFAAGLQAQVHGVTATDQDAANLRDTARGLIGFGRLSVPENRPELLKLWDGIRVEQEGRNIAIHADVPQSLVDQVVHMLSGGPWSAVLVLADAEDVLIRVFKPGHPGAAAGRSPDTVIVLRHARVTLHFDAGRFKRADRGIDIGNFPA